MCDMCNVNIIYMCMGLAVCSVFLQVKCKMSLFSVGWVYYVFMCDFVVGGEMPYGRVYIANVTWVMFVSNIGWRSRKERNQIDATVSFH